MATLYEQLGQSMSSAVEYGAQGNRFWELDQIQQKYDMKRKRMDRLFNALGYGLEAATKLSNIYSKNKRLEQFAKDKGYEFDSGFLGIGKGAFYKKLEPYQWQDTYSGKKSELITGDKQEASIYEVTGFDAENSEFAEIFKLYNGGK